MLSALGGEVLTTRPPGKSLERLFQISAFFLAGCAGCLLLRGFVPGCAELGLGVGG